MFSILPSSVSLSSSDFDENICGSHTGSKSHGFISDLFEELSLFSSVEQEDISVSEYSNSCVSSCASYDDSRGAISFCKPSLSSKTLELDAVETSLGYYNSWVSSGVSDILKTLNTKMVYKMLFHVRFPTLLVLFIDRRKNKIKKILTNSVKNTDVLFELSEWC